MTQTLVKLVKEVQEKLVHAAVPSATTQAQWLVAELGSFGRFDYLLYPEKIISSELVLQVHEGAQKLIGGMPLEYITGRILFDGHQLEVGPGVLIPRPETEELVYKISELWDQDLKKGAKFLDLGTGSGCLPIALALRFSQSHFFASDLSLQALEMAKQNAQKLGAVIDFRIGNWVEPWIQDGKNYFDFVISNPPYIGRSEEGEMSYSTLYFEPKEALFAEEEGLAVYQYFSKNILKITKPGSKVAFEIGYGQAESLLKIFNVPGWARAQVFRDISGHERFFFIERE